MREFFSDKKFIESKVNILSKTILVIILIFFFLPLIVLPFFNHPSTDDYFCGYQLHNKNFWQYQIFIYKNWGGRFAATFAGSLFAYHDFLYSHYYLHSLLFLLLNFCSLFFLTDLLSKHFLKTDYGFGKKILMSMVFLAFEICCLPQAATFIFWFSSAVTYQLPIILIQIEIALFILYSFSLNKSVQIICLWLLPALIFIIIGFNELFIIVQLLLFALSFYFKTYKKYAGTLKVLSIVAFFISSALVIFSPGNRIRMHDLVSKKIYIGIASVCYHSFETLWSVCKNPLFWFIGLAIFFHACFKKQSWKNNDYLKKIVKNQWIFIVIIFGYLIASVTLPVVSLKGGVVPDRYLNAVAYLMIFLLLFYFFIAGIASNLKIEQSSQFKNHSLLYLFLSFGLIFNSYIFNAYKSIIIAPTYSNILTEREHLLKHAAQTNKIATVDDYNKAVSKLIQTKYQSGTTTFQQIIQQQPPLLFFKDDLADSYTIDVLKNYYRLDSIIVKK